MSNKLHQTSVNGLVFACCESEPSVCLLRLHTDLEIYSTHVTSSNLAWMNNFQMLYLPVSMLIERIAYKAYLSYSCIANCC